MTPQLKHGTITPLLTPAGSPAINSDCCCGSGGCACIDATQCTDCTENDTPTQFHVTFSGITLPGGCTWCGGRSIGGTASGGNGTFTLTRNGSCGWSTFSPTFAGSGTIYTDSACTLHATAINFTALLTRTSATAFRLQIVDSSSFIMLFDATYTTTPCCVSFTVSNAITSAGCYGGSDVALGYGGSATVTPC
ncbi:MAG TPA: hypothetical protein VFC78_22055 [Tepidisphaeraceae bacterium]|nr:hypothetical protein [Tepidisphaeraceae bacterium]